MDFDTKLAVVIRSDLAVWQKLNVTAFLMSGLGGTQDILGQPYIDGSGVAYLPMAGQPIMVFAGEREELKELLKKALAREISITLYTDEIFETYNDEDNRAKVAEYATDDLNLAGIGLYGKKNVISRLTKGFHLHP